MILCLGDSLTFGSIGYSYIKFLDKRYKVINKGSNGDTTKGAYKRLKRYINSPIYKSVDTYIVEIGTNDVLLPFLSTVSRMLKYEMTSKITRKKCINDEYEFMKVYEKFIILLKKNNKNIILVGMPIIEMKSFPNNIIRKRNYIINQLSKKYNIPFVDAYSIQRKITNHPVAYSWKNKQIIRYFEEIIMLLAPWTKELFSKYRRLDLTVDGVHFNKISAKSIASEINLQLKQIKS